jgi:type IV secretion system protein VirB10
MTEPGPHVEHGEPGAADQLDPTIDEHRFSSEAGRPKSGKHLTTVFVGLAVLLAALGIGGYVAKASYAKYIAEKTEKQRVEREKTAETSRKGKVFALDVPLPMQAASTPKNALPDGFGIKKDAPAAALAIPLAGASSPRPAPPKRSMMIADNDGKEPPAPSVLSASAAPTRAATSAASLPLTPAQAAPTTVQEFARAQAAKSPLTASGQSTAARLGNRSLVLARGSYVPCALETDLNSNVPGPTTCLITANVFSDDGKVVLIEKGAHVLGEYGRTLKLGDTRIAVVWNRIKTPTGVVIDVDSPAADGTGGAGVEGEIDSHWMQRIGGAFLLSLVQDAVTAKTSSQQGGGTTINTANTSKNMAEKVLDSTINIAPTLIRNRGERLMILVNRDLWFDSVYSLEKRP